MARFSRSAERIKRHRRIRRKVNGTAERPRLCITKTLQHLYAQVVDDQAGKTLVQASTLDRELRGDMTGANIQTAEKLGAALAARALEQGVETVVFDRGGHPYHGVISAFAEACRKGGLRF